jgi:aldehyde dehydrogenase (NAD+)
MSSATLGNLLDGAWSTVGGDGEIAVTDPSDVEATVAIPFGGFLDSGSPFKEQGLEALRFYTRVKTVAVRSA